ncbi:MAG: ATP phosphoribosyltransferase [SAR202 cluster bacterium]|jgi:ATP phosphoribosyltransferase|nr:ATP phosphoribosyltransferase [SAR202 cluster bacterium]
MANNMRKNTQIQLAIPSNGALYDPTLKFLSKSGIPVYRSNPRKYSAIIPNLNGINILFQRTSDITSKVEEGSAELGIVGLDRYLELKEKDSNTSILINDLKFGGCSLLLEIPNSWIDISSLADLTDLTIEFRNKGKVLKIATKFPRLVKKHLIENGINHFSLIRSDGTLEVAPEMGFADIIADISSSGTTMRENNLKTIKGGTILNSQAILIGNKKILESNKSKLELSQMLINTIESHIYASESYIITANLNVNNSNRLLKKLNSFIDSSDITISEIYNHSKEKLYKLEIMIIKQDLLLVIKAIKGSGGKNIKVYNPEYIF